MENVVLKRPINSGSYFFNYKGTFSIVLFALVDADYKFIFIDVGCNGRISDGGVLRNSRLWNALNNNTLNIPGPREIETGRKLPFVIVADDAFTLSRNNMKPYPFRNLSHDERIFNYRLSCARWIVENAFGILASRFRIFLSLMLLAPNNCEKVILASCALHNYLRTKSPSRYTPSGCFDRENIDGSIANENWRKDIRIPMQGIEKPQGRNYTLDAKNICDSFCEFFNTTGSVSWQNDYI